MQAIRTRYHGPTNTRGSRITASCEGGALTLPRDYSLDVDQDHARAAQCLVDRLGWPGVYRGGSFSGDYYWVCESEVEAAPDLLACLRDVLDADGDLDAMDFCRYRATIAKATRGAA